jgi:hypothetical protein
MLPRGTSRSAWPPEAPGLQARAPAYSHTERGPSRGRTVNRVTRAGGVGLGSGLIFFGLPEVVRAHHAGAVTGGVWDWLGLLGLVLALVPVVIWVVVSTFLDRRKASRSRRDRSRSR